MLEKFVASLMQIMSVSSWLLLESGELSALLDGWLEIALVL